jgi:hypothetical protein
MNVRGMLFEFREFFGLLMFVWYHLKGQQGLYSFAKCLSSCKFFLIAFFLLFSLVFFRNRIFAPLPATERGKPVVLGRDPKLKNFIYASGLFFFFFFFFSSSCLTLVKRKRSCDS